ncbi:MAG: HDOD domain-containing protein [Candidatus Latescibacterota bacterium]|jgi:HD-like signal output (HDOD) protein/CheY-like chemotaxis protein
MTAKVLIIERNARIGGLIAGQLNAKGFEAIDVRHGAEAAVALRQQVADLVLLDNQVVMGGVQTARLMKLHPKYQKMPIVPCLPIDAGEAEQVIKDAQASGISQFLKKPFTMAALQSKIPEALEAGGANEQLTVMEIRDEIRTLTALPAMPEAHNKLLMLLSKSDTEVDLSQVARTLELDPALSARVMRTCKSAYFGFQGNMMKKALAFLGVEEVRQIVQSAVIYNVFGDEDGGAGDRMSMQDLWKHSLGVGMAMELLGKAVFKIRFPQHFEAVMDMVEKEDVSMLQAEKELLGITHAECGGELAMHWDLPGEVRTAIASHHSPAQTSQPRRHGPRMRYRRAHDGNRLCR